MDLTAAPVVSLLLLGILGLIGWHTASLVRRGRWMALDPLNAFWGGVVVVYVLQPIQYGDVLMSWHSPGVMEWALCWSLVAFGFVVLGYESPLGGRLGRRLPTLPAGLDTGRVTAAACVMGGLGLVGYAYLIGTAGGLWEWLSVPRGGTNWAVVNSYFATMIHLLPLGITLLLFVVNSRPVPAWAVATVWCLEGLMVLWQLYMGSRSLVIASVITMLAAYYLPRRRNPPVWLAAVCFAGLLVAVTFMGLYRSNFTDLSFHLEQIDLEEAERRVLPEALGGDARTQKQELAGGNDFNCVMSAVELVPNEVDYNYGYCMLEFLTRPIPRSVWPDKMYPHYEAFTPIYDRAHLTEWELSSGGQRILAGPAFTFVGHWYAVGGVVALALAGYLTGTFFRAIRTLHDRARGNQGELILYFLLVPVGFAEAASTPLFWIFGLVPVLIPTLGILLWCGEPSRQPAPPRYREVPRPVAAVRGGAA